MRCSRWSGPIAGGLLAGSLLVATTPAAAATGVQCATGYIAVTNTATAMIVGDVGLTNGAGGGLGVTTDPRKRFFFSVPSGSRVSVATLTDGAYGDWFLGAATSYPDNSGAPVDLGSGDGNTVGLALTAETAPGAPPTRGQPEGYDFRVDIESAIWSVGADASLVPQWINSDGSQPTTYVEYSPMSESSLLLTGDPPTPPDGEPVALSFVQTSTACPVEPVTAPTITATVTSAHPKTSYGYYRRPVTITYRCHTGSAPFADSCPAPVELPRNGIGQVIVRSVSDVYDNHAVLAETVNIDRTAPTITLHGAVTGHTYRHRRTVTCTATDNLSGVDGRCTIQVSPATTKHQVRYTATATDRAGNVTHKHGHYILRTPSNRDPH